MQGPSGGVRPMAIWSPERSTSRVRFHVGQMPAGTWPALAAGLVSIGVFVATQWHVTRPFVVTWSERIDWRIARVYLAQDLSRFLGLTLCGVVLVLAGRRPVFWVPAVAFLLTSVVLGWSDADCQSFSHLPAAVGIGWGGNSPGCGSDLASAWGPALMDLALVLA